MLLFFFYCNRAQKTYSQLILLPQSLTDIIDILRLFYIDQLQHIRCMLRPFNSTNHVGFARAKTIEEQMFYHFNL